MRIVDGIVIVVQCVWGVCEWVIMRRMTASGEHADQKSYKVLYVVTLCSLILGIGVGWLLKFDPIWGLYHASIAFPIVGSIVILAGLAFRLTAINTLKRFFTVNVSIQDDHKLITSGLYGILRHPAYTGGIISFIGCGLCYGNLLSLVCIAIPYTLLILMRIKNEERVLTQNFGQAYIDYCARTKKLIPIIY